MPFYTNVNKVESPFEIQQFTREIESGQPDAFLRRLQSFFADTPYELIRDLEVHYQNVLFIVFRLVGFYVKAEYHTSEGRVDLVLQTDRYIYVMEFKLEGSAEEALQQIEAKHYAHLKRIPDSCSKSGLTLIIILGISRGGLWNNLSILAKRITSHSINLEWDVLNK